MMSSSTLLSCIVSNNNKFPLISNNNNIDVTKRHDNESIEGLFSRNGDATLTKGQQSFLIFFIKHVCANTATSNKKQEPVIIKPNDKTNHHVMNKLSKIGDVKTLNMCYKLLTFNTKTLTAIIEKRIMMCNGTLNYITMLLHVYLL